ncbi:DUF2905 domain-containing protein [Herbivorax sp. ANBcel31]|uniref:DUF2905 domain-containing protein n=1 Tax=Herbivorax sp. ANBcel31 TaxID=3069754 RepID=UPI0027B31830|nr:DUF2905 domain-containing protein [Herbivorax sp. ANBcel31]MDQ2087825.1 DUF2905 domain-containing protein [Herbivorax sp. ANBcel31]
MQSIGKVIITLGIVLLLLGVILYFGGKIGIGKIPGDFVYKKGNFVLYFPLATSILLSVILTLIFALFKIRK